MKEMEVDAIEKKTGGKNTETVGESREARSRKGIYSRIIAVSCAVGSLDKSERNPHAKYNYVPIDDFYKEVARKAVECGLSWAVREVDCVVAGSTQTRNGSQPVFRYSYEFDMFDEDGNEVAAFSKLSILHPLQGPQTSGSAMSYAEKLMMRSTFKVVTGEKDADAVDPAVTNALNIRKAPAEWEAVANDIIDRLRKGKSKGEADSIMKDNSLNMALLREQAPVLYEKIVDIAGANGVVTKAPKGNPVAAKKAASDIDF